jgi:hypothetical protein
MNEVYWDNLPVGDIEHLKRLTKTFSEHKGEQGNLEMFFMFALLPYYEFISYDGLDRRTGHVIYNLSNFVKQEDREKIIVFRTEKGSIVDEEGKAWDSLEDWRKQWEKINPVIPNLIKEIPSMEKLLENLK